MTQEITLAEYHALLKQQKRRKYGNIPTPVDMGEADSQAEAARWVELRWLERAGEIQDLVFHPVFELLPGRDGWPSVSYEGDSQYWEAGKLIVEDVKGGKATETPLFKLKARLFVDKYPHIEFRIITR